MRPTYIDEVSIAHKRIFLRVDYNVSFNTEHRVADDLRITQSLPTIKYLLENNNRIILASHLGDPEERSDHFSLRPIKDLLQNYIKDHTVIFIPDFLKDKNELITQSGNEVMLLENLRFYPGEKRNDMNFAHQLASLADVYVNDAFGACHRNHASIVSLPNLLPAYGGLLLKKEIETISKSMNHPKKPFVAIIGGAKIETKLKLLDVLMQKADYVLIGGKLGNMVSKKNEKLILPQDGDGLDIGPKTIKKFSEIISRAGTILWNGPMGKFEDRLHRTGTDAIYNAIIANKKAISIVGGGDTIVALRDEAHIEKITHLSTGGGAMLEFIENGTLPGIEALTSQVPS